jgi:hypothetical protein
VLSTDASRIERCEILERNTDDLRSPTTGVFVGDEFHFIADAQWKGSKGIGSKLPGGEGRTAVSTPRGDPAAVSST